MSSNIARVNQDTANGLLITPPVQKTVFIINKLIAIEKQLVESHYPCGEPGGDAHCAASIITYSKTVFVNNKGVVRKGDVASCGHFVISGSSSVFAD